MRATKQDAIKYAREKAKIYNQPFYVIYDACNPYGEYMVLNYIPMFGKVVHEAY